MLFSQNIPPSPSPTESKSLFRASVLRQNLKVCIPYILCDTTTYLTAYFEISDFSHDFQLTHINLVYKFQ